MTAPQLAMKDLRRVVIAAAVGNVIEWYDFYIFGSLAALLSVKFFAAGASGSALIKTVGTFTAGFLIRPFGAFVFGRVGDIVGRKYTFLITLSGMGLSTALIGLVPSYAKIGVAAGILLLLLRLIQGLCLGGEYGGAITYVAEHAPDDKRGYYTGWLQTSPTLGIVVSLVVIIVTRELLGTEAFNAWGWRIPFLLSLLMVAIAIYIRLQLQETPIFQAIKAKGQTSSNPWREAFWSQNIRYVLIASVVVIGEGVVWYSGQFWALYFIQQVQKPDVLHPAIITGAALLLATPSLIFFGWLSDRIGRKPIILGGFFLAAVTYYPLYTALGNAANPASINYPLSILIVAIMVSYVGMVYGPIGAFLAEYFPARIRYSSVSVPYHIGNGWGGGLVPVITTAAYVTAQNAGLSMSQSLGHALVYPITVPAVAFLLGLFLMPETRKISISQPSRSTARGPRSPPAPPEEWRPTDGGAAGARSARAAGGRHRDTPRAAARPANGAAPGARARRGARRRPDTWRRALGPAPRRPDHLAAGARIPSSWSRSRRRSSRWYPRRRPRTRRSGDVPPRAPAAPSPRAPSARRSTPDRAGRRLRSPPRPARARSPRSRRQRRRAARTPVTSPRDGGARPARVHAAAAACPVRSASGPARATP